jgi:hypothetical protein
MSSLTHEILVDLFRNRPTMAPELLREVLDRPVPAFREARIESTDLTEIIPANRRADLLVLLVDEQQRPVLGIVVEVQLSEDADKPYVWPVYITHSRARHRCPTWLLVVTITPKMARWCSREIDTGHPGWGLTPIVLGPTGIPVVTDVEAARARPEVCVLSAMAHGQGEQGEAIGEAFLEARGKLSDELRAFYADVVLSSLNEAARRRLEAMLKAGYEYQSEFARTYVAQGKVEAKAQDVIAVLDARELEVPPDVRERILGSADLAELDRWIRRAAVVSEASQLFEPETPRARAARQARRPTTKRRPRS